MGPGEVDGLDDFSASGAVAGLLVEEEGDVGAELGGPGGEGVEGDVGAGELVEGEEGDGGVGTSSTESGAVGDVLGELDVEGAGDSGAFFKEAEGAGDEVGLIGGDAGGFALEGEGFRGGEFEGVVETGDGEDEGFEAVEAIGSLAGDFEREVDFSGSGEGHDGRWPRPGEQIASRSEQTELKKIFMVGKHRITSVSAHFPPFCVSNGIIDVHQLTLSCLA